MSRCKIVAANASLTRSGLKSIYTRITVVRVPIETLPDPLFPQPRVTGQRTMTAIVKFRAAPRQAQSNAKPLPEGHTAEVVLFPGVRYERHSEAVAAKPKRKRRSRAKQPAQMVVVG